MKSLFNTLIAPLMVTFVAGYLLYVLQKDSAEIVYALSEGIPSDFSSEPHVDRKYIHQLELRNQGTAEAKKIIIRIPSKVGGYKLAKYSETDNSKIYESPNSLEVTYPDLPPKGRIRLVFQTEQAPVNPSSIEISHAGGPGIEALGESKKSNSALGVAGFVLPLVCRYTSS